MKKLLPFLAFLLTISELHSQTPISVYDCNAIDPLVTPQDFQNSNPEFYQPCILFAPPNTYLFNGTTNKTIKAATEIHIQDGFHAGAHTGNGQTHLQIMPKSDFEVVSMNYTDLNSILKLKKFEIGVGLPPDILEKVNNFVNEVTTGDKLNPYLDWELRVFAEFSHPSLSQPIVIDGFYTKEFDSWQLDPLPIPSNGDDYSDAEYDTLGGYVENTANTNFPFRVRFAPPLNGEWSCKINIVAHQNSNQSVEQVSLPFLFQVIESGSEGYVKVGVNKRYLRRGDKTFFPLGCNMFWPETKANSDPLLFDYLSYYDGTDLRKKPEGYLQIKGVIPRVYDKYKEDLNALSAGGGNYYRSIMYPTATELEWEKLGDYTQRLHMAQEMDEIIAFSEEKNLFVHFDMQTQNTLQRSKKAYFRNWAWDSKMNGIDTYCYRKLIEEQYGTEIILDSVFDNNQVFVGMDTAYLGDCVLFLTDSLVKKYYKQRYRYILARWGYSTNVAVWELFCEISNVGTPKADKNDYYMTGNNYQIFQDWQIEMAAYLKSMYHGQIHLVTASYGGKKKKEDLTFESPYIDIMTSNVYDFNKPDFGDFWISSVAETMLNDNDEENRYNNSFRKPLIFSETDAIDSYCDENKLEWRRSVWQSVFSGLAGALSWDAQFFPQNFGVYGQIRDFIVDIDFDTENWHPGAVILKNNGNWEHKKTYGNHMDNSTTNVVPIEIMKADLSYLRSGDGNYAIGVLTNKTHNPESVDSCLSPNANWVPYYYQLQFNQDVNCENEKLKIKGANSGKYYINYFLPGSYGVPVHSSDDQGPNVKIEYTLQNEFENYLVPIKARKTGYNWLDKLEDETLIPENFVAGLEDSILTDESKYISVYPNPFENLVKIEVPREARKIIYTITTNEGRIVEQNSFFGLNYEINTKLLQTGTYFLTIYTVEDVFTFKIIKL